MCEILLIIGLGAIAVATSWMIYIVLIEDFQQREKKKGDDTHDHTR